MPSASGRSIHSRTQYEAVQLRETPEVPWAAAFPVLLPQVNPRCLVNACAVKKQIVLFTSIFFGELAFWWKPYPKANQTCCTYHTMEYIPSTYTVKHYTYQTFCSTHLEIGPFGKT